MEKRIFVAREQELAQLDSFLKRVLNNHGMVCFVTGEAGSGKTTLVTEFARRAQEQYTNLAVAVGQSDAQTGVGDANLPFREVLGQLTGDVDAKLAQGAITHENASRLRELIVLTGQALVEVGPDLIGVFVPGALLAAKAGAFAVKKVGWMDKLEHLVGKQKQGLVAGDSGIQQSQIFEQYANVLGKLSEKNPLLLVLDDLQWADSASIELLFHLARRIGPHSILLIGTYRPEEVAIGRAGERHPLEKVLTELKRYYGDVWVDLDQAEQTEGEQFVSAFLNTEPNQLKDEFCQKLFQHTGGHPLFTIELLRNMQERGDLVRDDQGRWVETPALDWESLPTRVEGVIEERINRLAQDLRQMLTVGSVEGEDFTAEVIARVQSADVRGLIPKLSGELERQHRLVRSEGIRQLEPAGQRLSLYRFQHNLFQKYLYNELGQAERVYLHEDVGNALETLFADRLDEIVVQLARHFDEAGMAEKAGFYLTRAGTQAANRYANDEAIAYFSRALDLTPESKLDDLFVLLLAREQVYGLLGKRELQSKDLTALYELVRILDNNGKRIEVTLQKAAYSLAISDFPTAITAAQEVIRLAESAHDVGSQATAHLQWGTAAMRQTDAEIAQIQYEQALALSRTVAFRLVEANCLRGLGSLALSHGDYDQAKSFYEQSLQISREEGDRRGESKTLNNLGVVFNEQGSYESSRSFYEQALVVFHEIGDRRNEGVLLGNLGGVSDRQGDLQTARKYLEQARLYSHEVGDRDNESRLLGNLGVVLVKLGDLTAAKSFYEQALILFQEIGRQANENSVLDGLSIALALQGDYAAANEYCERALQLARKLGDRLGEVEALMNLGVICDDVGDYSRARDQYEASIQIARSIGDRPQEGEVLALLGLLYNHLEENQASVEFCQDALNIAQEIGGREMKAEALTYWAHALVGLNQLAEATDFYQQSLTLRSRLCQPHMTMEPLAGLARICLLQEHPDEAFTFVEQILGFLEKRTLEGTAEPMRVYLTCYRVLIIKQDPRAKEVLTTAYRLLQERAGKMRNEAMRRSYLENVVANCEIIDEFAKTEWR